MNSFIVWFAALPWSEALALCILFSAVVSAIVWGAVAYFDPLRAELRAIRRKRRKERQIIISAQELARHRQECSVQTSRAFMRAYRESSGIR